MYIIKLLLTTFMLFSTLSAKNYFTSNGDMCDGTKTIQCPNDFNAVRNLQIALNQR